MTEQKLDQSRKGAAGTGGRREDRRSPGGRGPHCPDRAPAGGTEPEPASGNARPGPGRSRPARDAAPVGAPEDRRRTFACRRPARGGGADQPAGRGDPAAVGIPFGKRGRTAGDGGRGGATVFVGPRGGPGGEMGRAGGEASADPVRVGPSDRTVRICGPRCGSWSDVWSGSSGRFARAALIGSRPGAAATARSPTCRLQGQRLSRV